MRRGDRRLPAALLTAAAALGLAAVAVGGSVRADDDPWVAYDVVATADGARVTTFIPGGPLNDRVFDIGAPKAQARVDGLGSSTGYAAGVYPDELALNGSGIASGITKQDLPTYPLIASSSYPAKQTSSVDDGVVVLKATSSPNTSGATATAGATGTVTTGSTAVASASRLGDGSLKAQATSTTDGITIGPLTIARIASSATTTRPANGSVARSSSAVVTGAAIAGQAVSIDRSGLQAAESARAALGAAGITLRWLDKVDAPTGVTAPGVEITLTVPASLTGSGSSSLTYTFGRSAALVAGTPAPPGGHDTVPDLELDEECCADGAVGASPDASGEPRREVGFAAEPTSTSPSSAGEAGPVGPATPVTELAGSPVVRVVPETWPASLYVVFIGGAGLLALASLALYILGVRSTWRP